MKRTIILSSMLLLLSTVCSYAQPHVDFKKEWTYEKILQQAKAENKKIFIDFYTTWCGPCKTMDKDVFTDSQVANYMNQQFINFKVDAEAGEGVALAKKYKVAAYPTFVLLTADGDEIFRMSGANKAPVFLEKLKKGLDPANKPEALAQRYQNGERTPALINDYVLSIMMSGDEKKGFEIVNSYFDGLSAMDKADPSNLFLYERYALQLDDPKIIYLFAHVDDFKKSFGTEKTQALQHRLLRNALVPYANGYLVKNEKFDDTTYRRLLQTISRAGLPDSLGYASLTRIAEMQIKKEPTWILEACIQEFPKMTKSDRFLLMLTFGMFKDDRALADRASALIEKYIGEVPESSVTVLRRVLGELAVKGESIAFQQLTFQQALDKAKRENKRIFIDCFTTWCGPCKWLDENTFRDAKVVSYFDRTFINLKIDMEKGEGVELAKRLDVKAYPTMFILDADGTPKHKIVGAIDASKMMEEVLSIQ